MACEGPRNADAGDGLEGDDEGPATFPSNLDGEFTGSVEGMVAAELSNATPFRVLMTGPDLFVTGEGSIDDSRTTRSVSR